MAKQVDIKLNIDASGAKQNVDGLDKSVNNLNKDLKVIDGVDAFNKIQTKISDVVKPMQGVTLSLGEMKKELLALRNMSFANLSPEEIDKVKSRMADLTDGIGDFQAQIKTASADRIPALMDGLQGLVAGAQGVTGALAIFGIENKELEKTMVQLIGVSQALKTIQELQEKGTFKVMLATVKDTAAKVANAVAAKGQALATTGATKATSALGKAMMSNPYAAIAVAAAAAIAGIVLLVKYMKTQTSEMLEQSRITKELKGIRDDYTAGLEVEKQSMNSLFEEIKKTNVGTNERKVLVDELNRNYKDYLPNLDLEKATLEDLVVAQKESNVELQNKIAIQAQDEAMTEIITKMTDLKIKEMKATQKLAGAEKNRDDAIKSGNQSLVSYIQLYDKAKNELDAITFSLQAQEKQLKNVQEYFRGQITATIELTEEQKKALEEEKKRREEQDKLDKKKKDAIKAAESAYKSYTTAIFNANQEFELGLYYGEDELVLLAAKQKALYDAEVAYAKFSVGYSDAEKEKLKLLKEEYEATLKLIKASEEKETTEERTSAYTEEQEAIISTWVAKHQNYLLEEQILEANLEGQEKVMAQMKLKLDILEQEYEHKKQLYFLDGELTEEELNNLKKVQDKMKEMKASMMIDDEEPDKSWLSELLGVSDNDASQIIDVAVSTASNISDAINQIKLNKDEEYFNKRQEFIDKNQANQLAAFEGNEEKQNQIRAVFARKQEKLDAEIAKNKKKNAIKEAIMNAATSVISILASSPDPLKPIGPLFLAQLAGVVATTTAQLGIISSTKFAKGGLLKGPSHANGGVLTQFGELEGGEAVINKRSTATFAPLLSKINQVGGGNSFAQGQIIDYDLLASKINDKKVYVVSSEMSKQQGNDAKILNRASY